MLMVCELTTNVILKTTDKLLLNMKSNTTGKNRSKATVRPKKQQHKNRNRKCSLPNVLCTNYHHKYHHNHFLEISSDYFWFEYICVFVVSVEIHIK